AGDVAAETGSRRLLTIRDAAGRLQVSSQTVRRMIQAGLKVYRVGRQIRITEQDLLDYISA
ncbi:MAG: helix-turn-helix domain-containing protein, partial [Geminicoccaceae bacterium]